MAARRLPGNRTGHGAPDGPTLPASPTTHARERTSRFAETGGGIGGRCSAIVGRHRRCTAAGMVRPKKSRPCFMGTSPPGPDPELFGDQPELTRQRSRRPTAGITTCPAIYLRQRHAGLRPRSEGAPPRKGEGDRGREGSHPALGPANLDRPDSDARAEWRYAPRKAKRGISHGRDLNSFELVQIVAELCQHYIGPGRWSTGRAPALSVVQRRDAAAENGP